MTLMDDWRSIRDMEYDHLAWWKELLFLGLLAIVVVAVYGIFRLEGPTHQIVE